MPWVYLGSPGFTWVYLAGTVYLAEVHLFKVGRQGTATVAIGYSLRKEHWVAGVLPTQGLTQSQTPLRDVWRRWSNMINL